MLYPAMSELLKNVDSRYLLVNVVAHRARQSSRTSRLRKSLSRSPSARSLPASSRPSLTINTDTEHPSRRRQLACAGSFECRNQLIFSKICGESVPFLCSTMHLSM